VIAEVRDARPTPFVVCPFIRVVEVLSAMAARSPP
jgi:hypothetical protein